MDELLQALVQGMLIGSTYGLLALGMGLVYSVSGIVNFSHGDFVSLGMFLCLSLYSALSLDPYVALVVTVPVMMAIGGLVYWLLIRRIAQHHFLMIVQLTLGLALLLQNGLLMVYGGQPVRTPSAVESQLIIIGDVVMRLPHVIACGISFALAILLYVMLRATDFGRSIRAVHQNPHAAKLMGIDVARIQLLTFALSTALIAVAAALLLPGTPIHPNQGLRYTVITLLVVVLGGIVIGTAEALGTVYLPDVPGRLLPYLIFVLIMLFRTQGVSWRA
jgi:branched-chain amino acid transport system permease protein